MNKVTERIGDCYTTPLFWICACETDFLRSRTTQQCPHCQALAEESADADIALVLRYAKQLPEDETNQLLAAINAASEDNDLVEILQTLANHAGFALEDTNGAFYILTSADVIAVLSRMLEASELDFAELTGENLPQLLSYIKANLCFDWDTEIQSLIFAWRNHLACPRIAPHESDEAPDAWLGSAFEDQYDLEGRS
jgi:hypothetical protein